MSVGSWLVHSHEQSLPLLGASGSLARINRLLLHCRGQVGAIAYILHSWEISQEKKFQWEYSRCLPVKPSGSYWISFTYQCPMELPSEMTTLVWSQWTYNWAWEAQCTESITCKSHCMGFKLTKWSSSKVPKCLKCETLKCNTPWRRLRSYPYLNFWLCQEDRSDVRYFGMYLGTMTLRFRPRGACWVNESFPKLMTWGQ